MRLDPLFVAAVVMAFVGPPAAAVGWQGGVAVANPDPASLPVAVVASGPVLRLGLVQGDEAQQFERIVAALRLDDGSVLVADQGASEIRVFDSRGALIRRWGGSGSGPGEFQSLSQVFLHGDSIVAWDNRLWRLSVFSRTGSFVRSVALQNSMQRRRVSPVGILSNGLIAATLRVPVMAGRTPTGLRRDSMEVVLLDPDGSPRRSLATLPGSESFVLTQGRSTSVTDVPFGRQGHVTARGDMLVMGSSDSYRLAVLDPTGTRRLAVSADVPPHRVTDEDLDRARTRELDRLRAIGFLDRMRDNVNQKYDNIPHGLPGPAFTEVLSSRDGRLWVRLVDWSGGRDAPMWAIHDRSGRAHCTVRLPDGVRLMDAGENWIVGTFTDELDVPYVGLWELPPSVDRVCAPSGSASPPRASRPIPPLRVQPAALQPASRRPRSRRLRRLGATATVQSAGGRPRH